MRSAKCGVRSAKCGVPNVNTDQRRDFAVFPLATKIARSSLISVRRGEQLVERATFDSTKSSQPVFRFCGFFFADRYFVNEVIVRLCTNGFAVVCSNGCPAFEELVSQNFSDLGLRNSPDKFNHSKSKPLRSELKFVSHILWESRNWEFGMRNGRGQTVSQFHFQSEFRVSN